MRTRNIVSAFVVVWLIIGVVAAVQRGHFDEDTTTCARVSSTAGTIFVGPLNYFGVNPTVECPEVPEPSE